MTRLAAPLIALLGVLAFAPQLDAYLKIGIDIGGTVVGIGDEVALVDVGSKSEAVVDVAELRDDRGQLEVAIGDRIEAGAWSQRSRAPAPSACRAIESRPRSGLGLGPRLGRRP